MIEIIALALQTDSTRAITCVSGFANGDLDSTVAIMDSPITENARNRLPP